MKYLKYLVVISTMFIIGCAAPPQRKVSFGTFTDLTRKREVPTEKREWVIHRLFNTVADRYNYRRSQMLDKE